MNPAKLLEGENLLWLRDFPAALSWFLIAADMVIGWVSLDCIGGNLGGDQIRIAG
jgi:hypothetical protein